MSGSGISWAICKSAPRSRLITTPAPHHSVLTGRMPFLPPNQQRQSTEGTAGKNKDTNKTSLCEPPPSALNVTLPAFAAERRRAHSYRSTSPAHRTLNRKSAGVDRCDRQTDRQTNRWTDRQTDAQPCSLTMRAVSMKIFCNSLT